MSNTKSPVDNGVNVEALLAARGADRRTRAAKFKWRARVEERHA
jgi:hypothetical protein